MRKVQIVNMEHHASERDVVVIVDDKGKPVVQTVKPGRTLDVEIAPGIAIAVSDRVPEWMRPDHPPVPVDPDTRPVEDGDFAAPVDPDPVNPAPSAEEIEQAVEALGEKIEGEGSAPVDLEPAPRHPLDHDGDGRPGGSLPKSERDK